MKTKTPSSAILSGLYLVIAMLWSSSTMAQMLGHNTLGDFGVMSGTQPAPGTYTSVLYYDYRGDTLRDRDGNSTGIDPERRSSLDAKGYAFGLWEVKDHKVLGGNYSFSIWPSFTNNGFEAPILGLSQETSTGFADLYVQPINLGWNRENADYMAGIGIYAPTGSYTDGADDNLGMGMWSFELYGGTTYYLDQARSWTFATMAFYETHTDKEDSDVNVGDILTLEGGLGKSFKDGAITAGLAYYAQWKITDDDFGSNSGFPAGFKPGKHQGYGIGPEITVPIASSSKLYGFLNARYFWESGVESSVEGEAFVLTLTMPIPGIPLQ